MAVGRQDYQAGVVPIKSGYSLMQTPFYKGEQAILADGEQAFLCSEIVSTGYQLQLSGVRFSCNIPGIQMVNYVFGGYYSIGRYFDMSFIDNFPESSPLIFVATMAVSIYIKNETGETVTYYGELFGYTEQIET